MQIISATLFKGEDGPSEIWYCWGGDRQELLEMGDKQEMGEWIWNRGD